MPIYEYQCRVCGERFEVWFRRIGEEREVRCERCQSAKVRRQFSTPAVLHARDGEAGPKPGELRPVDPRRYNQKLAAGYATSTGDTAIAEVARQADRGDTPDQIHEFVQGVKQERQTAPKKRGTRR